MGVETWGADELVQRKGVCVRGEKEPGWLRGELWASRVSHTHVGTVEKGVEREGTGQVRWESTGLSWGLRLEDREEGTGQSSGGNGTGWARIMPHI